MRDDLWQAFACGLRQVGKCRIMLLSTQDNSPEGGHSVTGRFTDNNQAISLYTPQASDESRIT